MPRRTTRTTATRVYRLFYDTIKGGDFRAREANVYRLAEVSANIIDQCVAQGVPFAREYGGLLANRSFGGAQVSRTFYARGQTGQQLLLGAYSALVQANRRRARVQMFPRTEMLDLVVVDGHAKGIVVRDMVTGADQLPCGDAVLLCDRRLRQCLLSLDQRQRLQRHRHLARPQEGRALCQSLLHADPSDVHPGQRRLSVEAHAHVASRSATTAASGCRRRRSDCAQAAHEIPEDERDYYLERKYPSFGNLAPRDISSRAAKEVATKAAASARAGSGLSRFRRRHQARLGEHGHSRALRQSLRHVRADHRRECLSACRCAFIPPCTTRWAGSWVDYNLMSNVPGLFVLGEANFSDHGANRLGASALMQGLADGYFVIPYTIGNYLAPHIGKSRPPTDRRNSRRPKTKCASAPSELLGIKGKRTVDTSIASLAGSCGTTAAWRAPRKPGARAQAHPAIARGILEERQRPRRRRSAQQRTGKGRAASPTSSNSANSSASTRSSAAKAAAAISAKNSSIPDGEAKRDDENFQHVAAWEYQPASQQAGRHGSRSYFEDVHPRYAATNSLEPTTINSMNLKLKVWRQKNSTPPGRWSTSRPRTSREDCRSSRCSTS